MSRMAVDELGESVSPRRVKMPSRQLGLAGTQRVLSAKRAVPLGIWLFHSAYSTLYPLNFNNLSRGILFQHLNPRSSFSIACYLAGLHRTSSGRRVAGTIKNI